MRQAEVVTLLRITHPTQVHFCSQPYTNRGRVIQTLLSPRASQLIKQQRGSFELYENILVDLATYDQAKKEPNFASRLKELENVISNDPYNKLVICDMGAGNGVFAKEKIPKNYVILYACAPVGMAFDPIENDDSIDFYGVSSVSIDGQPLCFSARYLGGIGGILQSLPLKDDLLEKFQDKIATANFDLEPCKFVGQLEFPILRANRDIGPYEQVGYDYMHANYLWEFESRNNEVLYYNLEGKPLKNGWQYLRKINLYDSTSSFDLLGALRAGIRASDFHGIAEILRIAGKPLLDCLSAKEKNFLCDNYLTIITTNVDKFRNTRFEYLYKKYGDADCLAFNALGTFSMEFLNVTAVICFKTAKKILETNPTEATNFFTRAISTWLHALKIIYQDPTKEKLERIALECIFESPKKPPFIVKCADSAVCLMNIGKTLRYINQPQDAVAMFKIALETSSSKARVEELNSLIRETEKQQKILTL